MGKKSARFKFRRGVRNLRAKYGWTQKKLAKRAGISRRYLQLLESNNPPNVSVDMINKITRAFKAEISDLFI